MPQSYTCLHYHLVFCTKNRAPLITPDIRTRLNEFRLLLHKHGIRFEEKYLWE